MRTLYQAALQTLTRAQDGAAALQAGLDLIAHSEALQELRALTVTLTAREVIAPAA